MKKIVYAVLATVSALVLLFSYRTSLGASVPIGTSTGPGGSSGTGTSGSSGATSGSSGSGGAFKDGSFTGQAADTPYGPVQVRVTVSGGRITAVDVPEYPQESGRDQQINSSALPQLVQETVSAQSANVDMVSGATYTSQGYLQSLQSAIDQAKA